MSLNMPDRDRKPDKPGGEDELSEEELEAQRGGALPDREALSVLNADVAIPADPAIAADVLSGEGDPDDAGEAPDDPGDMPDDPGEEPPPDG
jgi:hypothetical protein